jgi:bifunctional DNA-binding transcriptional regulator/antitoxin component of YhaV-PrlF toxin-antitoxin module
MNMIEVIIGDNGEIIIPDNMRRNLDLFLGKKNILYEEDDSIHIIPSERKASTTFSQFAMQHNRILKIDSDSDYDEMLHDRVG